MRRLLWPLGLAAALSCAVGARAQQQSLSLDQALDLATAHSPSVSAAARDLEALDGALTQAGARLNPELAASVEDTRSASRVTTATLNLPVELGGKRAARVAAAERARDAAQLALNQAKSQARGAAVAAYFAVLVAQERVKLAHDSFELAAAGEQVIVKRVTAGKLSPVDATRARVDGVNAQLEVAEAQAELASARHALALLWGEAEPKFATVEGLITDVPQRPSLADLKRQLEHSPALQVAAAEVERRRAAVDVERSKGVPDLTVSVGARRDNELGRTQAVVGLSIPLPFFDRNQGAVYEASKRVESARDEYQAAYLRALTELQAASSELTVARVSVDLLRSTALPAAQEAYDAARRGFDAGKFGFLDVIDAQRALLQTRLRYLTTLANAYQAATAIDRLLGR